FKAFHIEQAKAFKRDLADQRGHRSGEPLSKATLYATLSALKRFFVWLAGQPGYKSRISYSDAEYFNLSAKETRIAKAQGLDDPLFPATKIVVGDSAGPIRAIPAPISVAKTHGEARSRDQVRSV